MKDRSKPRRNLADLAPLTPAGAFAPPTPHVVPDLRVEAALYAALQFERQRNAALTKAVWDAEAKWKRFRSNRLVRAIGSGLKPNRNPEPKGKA